MPTFTSFLNLLKPAGTDNVDEAAQLNANWDLVDTFASGTDGRLDALEAAPYAQEVAKSSTQSFTSTSLTDVTGLTLSPTVAAGETYLAIISVYIEPTVWTNDFQFFVKLFVDGVTKGTFIGERVKVDSVNHRMTLTKSWIVTGLSAGVRVFKAQANLDAANGTVEILGTHSTLQVIRIK